MAKEREARSSEKQMAQISLESSDSNDDQLSDEDCRNRALSFLDFEKLRCHLIERVEEIVNRMRL